MRLTSITPINIGPFDGDTVTIPIEPDLTILTGPNDTGKTFLLRVLELLGPKSPTLTESALANLVNRPYAASTTDWQHQGTLGCKLTIQGTTTGQAISQVLTPGHTLHVRFLLRPGSTTAVIDRVDTSTGTSSSQQAFGPRPNILRLPLDDPIRDIIPVRQPNPTEERFLQLAFGADYKTLPAYRTAPYQSRRRKAENTLNRHLQDLFGTNLRLALDGGDDTLTVSLHDEQGELTPLTWRGNGIRQLLTHVVAILDAARDTTPLLVLFDEPEATLHADLQHALRYHLETISQRDNIQVIYATHSSSMINNRHPTRVRLLEKVTGHDRTTIKVIPQPYGKNWLPVREGLGLTAADSLLYADITIIIEGPTELLALPTLLERLATNDHDLQRLLDRSHWLPGEGSSFTYFIHLAKSQRNKVIALLDGDKEQEVTRARKDHPDTPIILLPKGKEVEDLLPLTTYVRALNNVLTPTTPLTLDDFTTWDTSQRTTPQHPTDEDKKRAERHEHLGLSKRIGTWLGTKTLPYEKAKVMHRAAQDADATALAHAAELLHPFLDALRAINNPPAAATTPEDARTLPPGTTKALGLLQSRDHQSIRLFLQGLAPTLEESLPHLLASTSLEDFIHRARGTTIKLVTGPLTIAQANAYKDAVHARTINTTRSATTDAPEALCDTFYVIDPDGTVHADQGGITMLKRQYDAFIRDWQDNAVQLEDPSPYLGVRRSRPSKPRARSTPPPVRTSVDRATLLGLQRDLEDFEAWDAAKRAANTADPGTAQLKRDALAPRLLHARNELTTQAASDFQALVAAALADPRPENESWTNLNTLVVHAIATTP